MNKLVTHEALASKLLNRGHWCAVGITLPWSDQLTNSESLLEMMVNRMESDCTALGPKMRKPWNSTFLDSHPSFTTFD